MNLTEFIEAFAEEFDETPKDEFTPNTNYQALEEWDSLMSLSIVAMVDETMNKRLIGSDLRSCNTIEELYNLLMQK